MHQIKKIVNILLMMILAGCIKVYIPDIDEGIEKKYVVSGRITDMEGWQEVDVSLSTPVGSTENIPLKGCEVVVRDHKGNDYTLEEFEDGKYHVWMEKESLSAGTSYQVRVTTPDNEELVSGFDTMSKGPELDSVYYAIEEIPTNDPDVNFTVMQFYVDLNALGDFSHYYKWEVDETWEYNAAYPKEYYYDGTHHQIKPPDYTYYTCYAMGPVKQVFNVSTINLSQNVYHRFPLHRIDGGTPRLSILYSILVRQLALSQSAYNYWEQLRINSASQGGLYEKQPLAIKGNLNNLTHPEKTVLGYFYTASISQRRYFYSNVPGILLNYLNGCIESSLGRGGWKEFYPSDYPVFYTFVGFSLRILSNECIDCRLLGGTTVKPDYWPR